MIKKHLRHKVEYKLALLTQIAAIETKNITSLVFKKNCDKIGENCHKIVIMTMTPRTDVMIFFNSLKSLFFKM
jgi:hypothetical protein